MWRTIFTKKDAFFCIVKVEHWASIQIQMVSKIIALNEDEAYEWLERYNEVEAIEKYFSDRIEEA